ncbi:unnamed protein product [Nesidiocoris tenuis]|uniref:Uncharacterized protein n=1 Tax=Nesidiocoris tenuis TaxID=355587 RepID=A0A6H5FZY9_9HEMI|nr:unnamed protein product [Nesidiocoris tenuis]
MLSGQSHNPPTSSPSVASSGNNISPPGPPESKRLFQALKDSSRPNSIVVNVPLDVLPSASQGGTISVPTSSAANSIAPTSSASFSSGSNVHGMTSSNVMATTPLPQQQKRKPDPAAHVESSGRSERAARKDSTAFELVATTADESRQCDACVNESSLASAARGFGVDYADGSATDSSHQSRTSGCPVAFARPSD